jgi:hypothetical protein
LENAIRLNIAYQSILKDLVQQLEVLRVVNLKNQKKLVAEIEVLKASENEISDKPKIDEKRQDWKLLEVLFPIEFYELTGATPPLALQKAKPKSKWEIAKAEKFEREALALLTPEQRAKFDEDEALIRRDKEAQNALRQEVSAAKKRKRDAVEEAKIRLVEKEAKDKREAYDCSKRRRVDHPACQGNTVAPVTVPFVTPIGDPILPGDLFHQLQTAFAAGKFAIPGTASDPVVSDLLKALERFTTPVNEPPPSAGTSQAQTPQLSASTSQADAPQPSASTSQADAPQPSASTSQAKVAKTPRRQPAAGRKKAEASKEVQAQILNPPGR